MTAPISTADLRAAAARAAELVEQAGAIAMEVYATDFSSRAKADDSPVTEADRRVNAFLVDALRAAFPGDLVVGEESGFTGEVPTHGRSWFVDPVDGTKDFILKNDEWSIMVGLAVDGQAVLGVVGEPALGQLYWAGAGLGCWRRIAGHADERLHTPPRALADAIVVNSRNHPDPHVAKLLGVLGVTRSFEHGSVGCKLARIAEGRADAYFNFSGKCHMWDTCAPEVLLREAGGDLVDLDGRQLRYVGASTRVRSPFFAASAAVLEPIAAALAPLATELRPK